VKTESLPVSPVNFEASPCARVSKETAAGLRSLMFGSGKGTSLPQEWWQGWCFEDDAQSTCPYGLRQFEGGPCGVVAVVQAFLLRSLWMASSHPQSAEDEQCQDALLDALTDVLFQCAPRGKSVSVLIPPAVGGTYTAEAQERVLSTAQDCCMLEFSDWKLLRLAWEVPPLSTAYIDTVNDRTIGVVLFLYSALLTRGLDTVRLDVDLPTEAAMVGAHGYCTQEAVNLLLTGVASSNVFDGETWLEGALPMRLGGIYQTPKVGFLSLFETYGSVLEVGSLLKRPACPVWVVHAESHYSVLFGSPNEVQEEIFDLWYYDPLGRQDEEKRITVKPNGMNVAPDEDDWEANGMIAQVIRTRWGELASLDWNGAEPIY